MLFEIGLLGTMLLLIATFPTSQVPELHFVSLKSLTQCVTGINSAVSERRAGGGGSTIFPEVYYPVNESRGE